jgi:hypothetical protein
MRPLSLVEVNQAILAWSLVDADTCYLLIKMPNTASACRILWGQVHTQFLKSVPGIVESFIIILAIKLTVFICRQVSRRILNPVENILYKEKGDRSPSGKIFAIFNRYRDRYTVLCRSDPQASEICVRLSKNFDTDIKVKICNL